MTSTFKINGMTCEACVKTVTEKLKTIPDVSSVDVDFKNKKAEITSSKSIMLNDVRNALLDVKKYSASFYDEEVSSDIELKDEIEKSFFKTYKPLLIVFVYILILSSAYQLSLDRFSLYLFMNHLMAGFFVGLSFFKFLDLKAFAEAFSNYDPVAKKWRLYGFIYPFIELGLGFLYIANLALTVANIVTVLVLTTTTLGVYQKLQSKTQFQCACLGAGFSLPLSNITIIENVVMVVMAIMSFKFV